MKLKAREMGSMKALKESLKKGGGSSEQWIKNIPAEGVTVRFLTEPEQWFGFDEYWDDIAKAFVPMAEGEVLPDGARKSFRYLCIAVDTETDRVIPLKLPKTAANALILKYDKYDTMMDRDYELQKHGEGLDTTYEVTPEGQSKRNLGKYEMIELEGVLLAARRKALGEDDMASGASDSFDAEDVDDDDDTSDDTASDTASEYDESVLFPDDDFRDDYTRAELELIEGHEGLAELAVWWDIDDESVDAILKAQGADDDDDDEDDEGDEEEAEVEVEVEEDDEVEYSEEDLRAMSIRELRLIANDLGIAHRGKAKDDLIDEIIEEAED